MRVGWRHRSDELAIAARPAVADRFVRPRVHAPHIGRCVSGSYELGGQVAPPIVPGFIAIGSVQNGVKILPSAARSLHVGVASALRTRSARSCPSVPPTHFEVSLSRGSTSDSDTDPFLIG